MKTSRQLKLVIEVKMKDFGNEPHIRKPETFSSGSWSYDRRDSEIIKYHSHSEASITQVYVIICLGRCENKESIFPKEELLGVDEAWSCHVPYQCVMR